MNSYKCRFSHGHHQPLKHSCSHHHDHDHDDHNHDHHHHAPSDKKLLRWSFGITFGVMLVEILGGIYANSLALISDAIHMFTHAFALALSLFALTIATKEANEHKTFGYFRAEVLAAFVNGLMIVLSVLWIVYEALVRLWHPEEILSQATLIVAVIGLVVNVVTGLLLLKADHDNINIRSAFLHMVADTFSSVAIIIGAIIIAYTQWYIIDTLLALVVSVVIAKWAYTLLGDSIHVLLEGSPHKTSNIKAEILEHFPQVLDVHDLHCWEMSQGYYILTAHLVVQTWDQTLYDSLIHDVGEMLEDHFRIGHATFQIEHHP